MRLFLAGAACGMGALWVCLIVVEAWRQRGRAGDDPVFFEIDLDDLQREIARLESVQEADAYLLATKPSRYH